MGEWRNGIIEGKGIFTLADGNKYDGEYLNGLKHGRGIFILPIAIRN